VLLSIRRIRKRGIDTPKENGEMEYEILSMLEQHEATGTSDLLEDKAIAQQLNTDLVRVQRELEKLEDQQLITIAKTFGPSYAAQLTPRGRGALRALEPPTQPPNRPIGF
jgi:hypothetical protein